MIVWGAEPADLHALRLGPAVKPITKTVHTLLTVHHTGPNLTSEPRRAWIIHFGPFGRWAKLSPRILAERMLGRLGGES